MSSILGPIGPEKLELFALEMGKFAAFDYVCSHASTNINQSAPNLVTMYMSIRSQMSLNMGQVIPDQSLLSALEIEKLNFYSLIVFLGEGGGRGRRSYGHAVTMINKRTMMVLYRSPEY